MIKIQDHKVEIGSFPDGTMLIRQSIPVKPSVTVQWYFESDRETLALVYLTNHLKAHGCKDIHLYMPYIPNARQDRVKTEEDIFTLKYFADIINSLGFQTVTVLDPHSHVSEALIDRIVVQKPTDYILQVIDRIRKDEGETPAMFYPDEGAGKRYGGMIPLPYAFGIKKRDWESGQIKGLDVVGDVENLKGKTVLIVDDICSKGGTFYHSAKRLLELGAKNVYLYVSHLEHTVFDGDLLNADLIKHIFTTDSIFHGEHQNITVIHAEKKETVQ